MSIDSIIRRAAERQASLDSEALPKSHTLRIKSLNERDAKYNPVGYGLYFCLHDKSYYEICTACRRTTAEVQRNISSI